MPSSLSFYYLSLAFFLSLAPPYFSLPYKIDRYDVEVFFSLKGKNMNLSQCEDGKVNTELAIDGQVYFSFPQKSKKLGEGDILEEEGRERKKSSEL